MLSEDLDLHVSADTTEVSREISNVFFPVFALHCLDFTKLLVARQLETGSLGTEIKLDHRLGTEAFKFKGTSGTET